MSSLTYLQHLVQGRHSVRGLGSHLSRCECTVRSSRLLDTHVLAWRSASVNRMRVTAGKGSSLNAASFVNCFSGHKQGCL